MHLIEWLKKHKKSQADLVRDTGISDSCIQTILKKKSRPSVSIAKMIELYTKGEVTEKELRGNNDIR